MNHPEFDQYEAYEREAKEDAMGYPSDEISLQGIAEAMADQWSK